MADHPSQIKEKPKSNKRKVGVIILSLFCIAFIVYKFNIPIPFRYEFKGTSQGYIYKIDRFTGKSWIVGPTGEKLIKEPQKEPELQPFPINSLQVLDQKATITNMCVELSGTVKNNSGLTASYVQLRVNFSKEKQGEPFHYEVFSPFKTVADQIQPYSSKSFTKCASFETYQILKDYKNWLFSIFPFEAKIAQD